MRSVNRNVYTNAFLFHDLTPHCSDSGYKGRIGIYEAIRMDQAVEKVIADGGTEQDILISAQTQNIPTLQEDGVSKLINGATSLSELTRVIDLTR